MQHENADNVTTQRQVWRGRKCDSTLIEVLPGKEEEDDVPTAFFFYQSRKRMQCSCN